MIIMLLFWKQEKSLAELFICQKSVLWQYCCLTNKRLTGFTALAPFSIKLQLFLINIMSACAEIKSVIQVYSLCLIAIITLK